MHSTGRHQRPFDASSSGISKIVSTYEHFQRTQNTHENARLVHVVDIVCDNRGVMELVTDHIEPLGDFVKDVVIMSCSVEGLDPSRLEFRMACIEPLRLVFPRRSSLEDRRTLASDDFKTLALDLVLAVQSLPASRLLPSTTGRGTLLTELSGLIPVIESSEFDAERIVPLLRVVVNKEPDEIIFAKTYAAMTEATPPPRPQAQFLQTPYTHSTSSVVNSSEQRQYMDGLLKEEMGPLYIGIPGFHDVFAGKIPCLEENAAAVFKKCQEGGVPLYREDTGWRDWPKGAQEKEVLKWFAERVQLFRDFAEDLISIPSTSRGPLTRPNKASEGSTAGQKPDIGFVEDLDADEDAVYHWSQILVPGELKGNPAFDMATKTWLDLARYAREVLIAQDTRRFVLGFTLCGSIMRLWEFDRVGGIASEPFDINKDGLRFVSAVLGFLWMDREQLGFDPTIVESDGVRYMKITRNGRDERLILDALMRRGSSVVGRATTCWRAYREGDKSRAPLVIKDSWQYPERDQEGELLREATEKGVENVARYYHHETVQVGSIDDDVQTNIRKVLDISKAANFLSQSRKTESSMMPPSTSVSQEIIERGRSFKVPSGIGRKRSSSSIQVPIPAGKRTCSTSPTKKIISPTSLNRIHRRVIVSDYGKPIYRASSWAAMLAALEGCIKGYKALYQAGILHRDISVGNLMMNEDPTNPSWPAFLIDLDLAIRTQREGSSGAHGKTGTRAFMAIWALLGKKHSAMHDYESFFWVLFWICIHYDGPNTKGRAVRRFEKWNFMDPEELAGIKLGLVADEEVFLETLEQYVTLYYRPP
ncbi:hypothetical protein AYL99_09862 [Fonsecaea erecta]|uniref:non-specific serine/threonine protein kinase n=1 Tax=Fonsecaea erecta TaxID=1367422 RepID=A0A178Z7F1_9EURO|nr:hypothetical protein AYL99_09862 [Fonsecaea erecta]OAP55710.1 hypothetical protein AYL99_09862 [Fonsecaea erecta]